MTTLSPARKLPELSATKIVLIAFLCLLVGHLALQSYFSSPAINGLGILLIVIILYWVLFIKKDVFGYVLIIFGCSMFQYAGNQGGLFNLAAFLLSAIYLVINNGIRETKVSTDAFNISLILILLVADILGLFLKNPISGYIVYLEAASFSSFLLTFYIASHINLTEARLKKLITIIMVMIAYNFIVSVNQHYLILKLNTPLLGVDESLLYKTTNSFGAFGSFASSAQFSLMMLAFLIPLACSSVAKDKLKINAFTFVIVAMLCVLTIVFATQRAAATETVMIVVFYSIMFTFFYRRAFKHSKYLYIFSFILVLSVTTVGALINFDNMIKKFQQVTNVDVKGVETGKSINRGEVWAYGIDLLSKNSYWIGYGHGVFQSNNLAWGGRLLPDGVHVEGGGHLHNLYLALPTLYGWTGSAAYMLLFLSTVWRLFKAVKKNNFSHPMVIACLGFLMSVVLFLIDETKGGNAVHFINYPMIAWIWLGLANAAVRTLRFDLVVAKTNGLSGSSVSVQTHTPKMKSV